MKVRNKAKIAVYYPFIGSCGRMLAPGAVSRRLNPMTFYDPLLQRALQKGLVEVEFDEEDVAVIGAGSVPGPVAQVLSALRPEAPAPDKSGIVTKPVPVVRLSSALKSEHVRKKPVRTAGRVEKLQDGAIRAQALARELKIPVHVLAAAVEETTGKRVYPLTGIDQKTADAMRERYLEKLEIPEISKVPRTGKVVPRTLSDLSASADGVLTIAEIEAEDRRNGL
jgi:hypothetical protein